MNDDYQPLAAENGSRTPRQKAMLVVKVALAALGVLLFLALLWLRTWPPLDVVMSGSMEPTIKTGDVVVMKRLNRPAQIGDIVAVHPPQQIQQRLNYPDTVIHRIVKISPDGKVYTKGDARNQRDPFTVPLDAVKSRVVATIPSAGRIVAFFTSPLGLIWLGGGLLLFLLLPYLELRRDQVELEQAELGSLAMIRMELQEISNRVEGEHGRVDYAPPATLTQPSPAAQVPSELRNELDEMRNTMGELVAAVGEYGEHLRSHTAVLQGMSAASQDLAESVAALRSILPTPGLTVPVQPAASQATPARPQPIPPSQAQPIPAPAPAPPTASADQLRQQAEAFLRWQEQRAIKIAISMGFRDPLSAARVAPLDDAADDESIERKLWELAFENPRLIS